MFKTVIAGLSSSVLVLSGIPGFINQESMPEISSNTSQQNELSYSETDVIEFFAFGQGAIAESNPMLAGFVPSAAEAAPASAVNEVLELYKSVDPEFETIIVNGVNSGDPLLTEAALNRFVTDSEKIAANRGITIDGTQPGANPMAAVVFAVVAIAWAGAVAVQVVLVANVNAVWNAVYSRSARNAEPGSITMQNFAYEFATEVK